MTAEIELQRFREGMDSNGYAHFNREAFEKNQGICYIPENAETLDDMYTRNDLKELVEDWLEDNPEYQEEFIEDQSYREFRDGLVKQLFEELEWQDPSTVLEDWLNGFEY